MDKRERAVKLKKKKNEFEYHVYGKDAEEVMYITATKIGDDEEIERYFHERTINLQRDGSSWFFPKHQNGKDKICQRDEYECRE